MIDSRDGFNDTSLRRLAKNTEITEWNSVEAKWKGLTVFFQLISEIKSSFVKIVDAVKMIRQKVKTRTFCSALIWVAGADLDVFLIEKKSQNAYYGHPDKVFRLNQWKNFEPTYILWGGRKW